MPRRFYVPFSLDDLSKEVKDFIVKILPEEGVENISSEYQEEKRTPVPEVKRRGSKTDILKQYSAIIEAPPDPLQILLQDEEAGFNIWDHPM